MIKLFQLRLIILSCFFFPRVILMGQQGGMGKKASLHKRSISQEQVSYSSNYGNGLPATDSLNRSLPGYTQVGPEKKDRFVGLFYWTWHTEHAETPAYNTTQIINAHPEIAVDYNSPWWPQDAAAFFWEKPLFGYYRDTDQWVLRKHAEMLADAGVDVIFFDCTNGSFTWKESYMALCKAFEAARKDGIKTPQIAFMMAFAPTSATLVALKEIYHDLYQPGLYKDLWFYWKGKPLIMAYPETLTTVRGDTAQTELHEEIKRFFTFRPGMPAYNVGPTRPDHWGWLEVYPQHSFGKNEQGRPEEVTVGVAQNWSKERGLTAMNAPHTFGRSYTDSAGQIDIPGAENYGFNFQEQWNRALKLDPEFIFITGWNEWIAGRAKDWQQQKNAFPDEFSPEKSRDIEPVTGSHGDNYYYQMVANIRRFKGMPRPAAVSGIKTIRIDGKFDDWKNVFPEYAAHKGSIIHRDSKGWKGLYYTNHTGRNDIILTKVARDKENVYFYVRTENVLTPATDAKWMRLFIDVDGKRETGWEGYDFVLNRLSPGKKAFFEKNSGNIWKWEKEAEVNYARGAREMEIAVPRRYLQSKGKLNIRFKWSDNMQKEGDLMDFYLNGEVAPPGRFNYEYAE